MSINKCFAVVAGMFAALWCGSAEAAAFGPGGGVVTNTGRFVVSESTTYTGYTNIYTYTGKDYGAIDADLTLNSMSYLRLMGANDSATDRILYVATNANADLTITINGKSSLYASYRNSTSPTDWVSTGIDPYNTDKVPSNLKFYLGAATGDADSSGRAKFIVNTRGSYFGGQANATGLWAEYLYIEPTAKAHATGYVDFLQINSGGWADITHIENLNTNHPARIVFNGGRLRNSYENAHGNQLNPATNTVLALEGINNQAIHLYKEYNTKTLNDGMGTVRFQGDCEVWLEERGSYLPGISGANRNPHYIDSKKGPIEWKQTGALAVIGYGFLQVGKTDGLPFRAGEPEVRLRDNAILDPNAQNGGHRVKVRTLISESGSAMVTNVMASFNKVNNYTSTLVFGDGDTAGIFSAKCYDHVNIEKVGSGTLVISNATVDVNATGTGKLEIKEGTVVFSGTNKIGAEEMYGNANCIISDGVKVIKEIVVNVASGTTTQSEAYADTNEYAVRLRKTGAGTLVLNNSGNTFSGGLVIDQGIVKVTADGAQGLGKITVNSTSTKTCQIKFAAQPPITGGTVGSVTFTNDIEVTGKSSAYNGSSTTWDYVAIRIAHTNQVLTGSITAQSDLYIADDAAMVGGVTTDVFQKSKTLYCRGPISVAGTLYISCGSTQNYYGKITAEAMELPSNGGYRSDLYLHAANAIKVLRPYSANTPKIRVMSSDALVGAAIEWPNTNNSQAEIRGTIDPSATSNMTFSVKSLSGLPYLRASDVLAQSGYTFGVNAGTYAYLMKITGEAGKTAQFCGGAGDKNIAVELAAPSSFTQIFSNVYYCAKGELKVSGGTLIIAGKSYFPNLTTITVAGDGILDIRGLGSPSAAVTDFLPKLASFNIESGAKLKLAEGIVITSSVVKVDGFQLNADTYSKSHAHKLAWLEGGGSLTATASPSTWTAKDATWSGGAGEDKSTETAANWATTPAPAFYYHGYRPIFGEDGREAVFPAGVSYLCGLKFTRDADFTVNGANDTTSLKLDAGIEITGTGHVYTIDAPVVQSVASTLKLTDNTKLVFNHAYEVAGNLTFGMTDSNAKNAEIDFAEPVTVSGNIAADSGSKGAAPYLKVKFAATGNKGNSLNLGYMNVHFLVTNAFDNTPFTIAGGENESPVNFHNTRQQTPTFSIAERDNGKGQLSGEYPATLAITNGWTDRDTAVTQQFGSGYIAGWLKLEKSGPGYQILGATTGAARTYDSYGDIEVSGGTLEILPNATWLNGTNFIVKGTGKLILTDDDTVQIGPQAVVHFGGANEDSTSNIEIPSGVTYTVESIYVGDTRLPPGTYDKNSTGSIAGRITGDGKLRVKNGTMLIFR